MYIVLIIIILVYLTLDIWSYKLDHINRESTLILKYIIFGFILLITIMSIYSNNEYRKGVKCPELEKVENVYRIK